MQIISSIHHPIDPAPPFPTLLFQLCMQLNFTTSLAILHRHIIIHLNALNLEHSITYRRPTAPPLIAIRPIIPHPGPRLAGHIGRERLLQQAVEEEHRFAWNPVGAIFVQDADVQWSRAWGVGGCSSGSGGLVRVLEPGGRVGAGV
jgi:hypothetical protein